MMADEDLDEVAELAKVLSNPKRLQIILELSDGPKSIKQLHESQDSLKYRDSTYRHVEKLFESGIVDKNYDHKKKDMEYELVSSSIKFEFLDDCIDTTIK